MATATEQLMNNIRLVRFNPTEIQRYVHRLIPDISNGEHDVIDPSNPFTFVIEAACTLAASNMTENSANNRRQYATAAQSKPELYRHMADHDLTDIFALPCTAPFFFAFSREELQTAMVQVPGTDIKKLVIPRNTTVTIAGITFSIQYPIEIRQMGHGGIQVVWDTEYVSPLFNIETNLIESQFIRDAAGVELLVFSVPMQQFSIVSLQDTVSLARKFTMNIAIEHQYYFCRVWVERVNGGWVELPITYSQEIYPSNRPTAIILVNGKDITVELPIIYMKSGAITGKIRADVYQTQGPLSLDLSGYDAKEFVANWLAIDKSEQTQYVAPLKNIQTLMAYSVSIVSGGKNAMTFEQLKQRVIDNSFGHPLLPITPAQAQSRLERKGYNIVKNIDNLTDRIFKATRAMPQPEDPQLITAASAGIHTLTETMQNLSMLSTAYENDEVITLTPKTMYALDGGLIRVCSDAERDAIDALPGDKKAILITEGSYFFSPFHYVLDGSDNKFSARAYYLDSPKVNSRTFVSENDTTMLQVSIGNYLIERTALGWQLFVTTASSQAWKNLMVERQFATIGYRPDRTGDMAYIRGEMVATLDSGEQVWRFNINTTYDINSNHEIMISNANMYEVSEQFHRASLTEDFELFFSTSEPMPMGWNSSNFDQLIGAFLVDHSAVGVTRERLNITLGYPLENLWSRARSVAGENNYARWDVDVPAKWESDVYVTDPVTGVAKYTVVNGKVVFQKLHSAGDVKTDGDGNVIYKYRKGDIKHDAYGKPIVIDGRSIVRQMDLFLLEAPYFLATTQVTQDYLKRLVGTLVGWVTDDLTEINRALLDKTKIFYTPTQNVGLVDVIYGAGLKTTINASQYFNLKLYVRDSVYKNEELKEKIRSSSVSTIASCLTAKTVSTSDIVNALKNVYQDDVLSFEIEGLGGVNKLSLCTMVDDSVRLTLRKRLVYRVDQTFAVEEDVNVEFVPHERSGVVL